MSFSLWFLIWVTRLNCLVVLLTLIGMVSTGTSHAYKHIYPLSPKNEKENILGSLQRQLSTAFRYRSKNGCEKIPTNENMRANRWLLLTSHFGKSPAFTRYLHIDKET